MSWEILYGKQAQKGARKLVAAGLKDKVLPLLAGAYFRRINIMCRYRDGVFKSGLGPKAEVLFFACPKKSTQKKRHPMPL
ncbi:hypothetical protein [Methylomonas rivi]|uniref:Uncharacterized protein n=1 Tax=Methylomonas rivi TaxID=2952226 RepID=A0ABT1U1J0_9GAMM|nr:hypothetical protein [Methylomonas sp. WSC-6]MCQ8127428.1 hypothetical protein [Methylomonas sp. WSC-6]